MKNARIERASASAAKHGGDHGSQYNTGADAHTARPHVGEIVEVHGLPGRFEVVSNSDPAVIVLRNDQGVELRVGERQVIRVEVGR